MNDLLDDKMIKPGYTENINLSQVTELYMNDSDFEAILMLGEKLIDKGHELTIFNADNMLSSNVAIELIPLFEKIGLAVSVFNSVKRNETSHY